jgi:hypothetical protein
MRSCLVLRERPHARDNLDAHFAPRRKGVLDRGQELVACVYLFGCMRVFVWLHACICLVACVYLFGHMLIRPARFFP